MADGAQDAGHDGTSLASLAGEEKRLAPPVRVREALEELTPCTGTQPVRQATGKRPGGREGPVGWRPVTLRSGWQRRSQPARWRGVRLQRLSLSAAGSLTMSCSTSKTGLRKRVVRSGIRPATTQGHAVALRAEAEPGGVVTHQ